MYKTKQNIIDIYTTIITGDKQVHIDLHDDIINNTSVLFQYYLMKAFKCSGDELFYTFASNTGNSVKPKQIFHNILSIYEESYGEMKYCHSLKEALPNVNEFLILYELAKEELA